MAFKGKTTIELTNAETGAVEQKIEDENMVTNAVYNLVNGSCSTTELNTLLNNCFSGLLLFEKNITEDINVITLPAGNKMIGKAAGAYSSENEPLIGNLNTAESAALDNGYRYVWDFPTNRGNGTIRCVCLTSYNGGLNGYELTPDPGSNTYIFTMLQPRGVNFRDGTINKRIMSSTSLITTLDSPYSGYPIIGYINKKLIFASGSSGVNSVSFYTRVEDKRVHLKSWTSYIYTEKLVSSTKKLCHPMNLIFYEGKYYSIYVTSKTTFDLVVFNADTFDIEREDTITCQDVNFMTGGSISRNPIIYKD